MGTIVNSLRRGIQRYSRYFFNLGASFFAQVVTALSILLLTPILLKTLGPDGMGFYGVLLNVILLSAVFDFGLNTGLLRKLIHEKGKTDAVISSMFYFFVSLLFIAIPLFYLLFRFHFLKTDQRYLLTSVFTSLIVVQNMLAMFFEMMIQSANKIFVGKMIRIIKTVLEFIVLLWLSRLGSIVYLLLGTVVINFIFLFALAHYARKEVRFKVHIALFSWKTLLDHARYGFWYFQTTLSSVLVYNAQIILISSLVEPALVSRYFMVMRFFDVLRTGMGNFTMILFPSLSMMQAEAHWKKLHDLFLKVLLRVSVMVAVAFLVVLTLGEYCFIYWSKLKDADTLFLFRWYAVLICLLLIEHVPVVFLSALKFNKLPSIIGTIQGVLGLLLTYWLVPRHGLGGAVIASIIALLVTNFLFNPFYLFRKIRQHLAQ